MTNCQDSTIDTSVQRRYDAAGAPWLVTLNISTLHGHKSGGAVEAAFPQCAAVIDDFGTLVFVRPWR